MSEATVTFEVTPSDDITGYWLQVQNRAVPLVNGHGAVAVPKDGKKKKLTWHFTGAESAHLAIVGKMGEQEVVAVNKTTIPAGGNAGAGTKLFVLPS